MDILIPKSVIPEGQVGSAIVERFQVTEEESRFSSLRAAIGSGGMRDYCPPGIYTRLKVNGILWMSDTDAEIRDHREPVRRAKGRCLVTGLGLGVVVYAMLCKQEVEHVTVIEINQDIIDLVGFHLKNMFRDRLEIICADAYTWKPPRDAGYNVVWHDIWVDLCTDNLPDMTKLKRKFGRKAAWQGCWGEEDLRRRKRREDREDRFYRWS